jgi:hypothetical protein
MTEMEGRSERELRERSVSPAKPPGLVDGRFGLAHDGLKLLSVFFVLPFFNLMIKKSL